MAIIHINEKELAKGIITQYNDYYNGELENFNTDDYIPDELLFVSTTLKEKKILNFIDEKLDQINKIPNKKYQKLALKQLRNKIDNAYPYDTFGVQNEFVDDIISYLSDPKVLTYNDLKGRHI